MPTSWGSSINGRQNTGNSKRLEIIYQNGMPDGIRICLCHCSPMKAFVIPRRHLAEAKSLTGIDRPGVNFLINNEDDTAKRLYIGQTRNGIARLEAHNTKKSFWNTAVLFLADSEHFTMNILCGLQKYAILAAVNGPSPMENKAVPKFDISEYDLPLIESFYEEIRFVMTALGFPVLRLSCANDCPYESSNTHSPDYALSHPVICESIPYRTADVTR